MIATIGLAISLNSTIQGLFGAENLRFPVHGLPPKGCDWAVCKSPGWNSQIILLSFLLMAVLLWC